jgi:hypothetical protein
VSSAFVQFSPTTFKKILAWIYSDVQLSSQCLDNGEDVCYERCRYRYEVVARSMSTWFDPFCVRKKESSQAPRHKLEDRNREDLLVSHACLHPRIPCMSSSSYHYTQHMIAVQPRKIIRMNSLLALPPAATALPTPASSLLLALRPDSAVGAQPRPLGRSVQ